MTDAVPAAGQHRSTVLLVCPPFFSYHQSIAGEIVRRGHRVIWWNDRPSQASLYKLLLRLLPRQVARLSHRHFAARIRELDDPARIRNVLVVKGEGLSKRSVETLRAALPNARFSYYSWDGLENVKGARDIAPLFDAVATFDPADARTHGWMHRPLFARDMPRNVEPASQAYDWAFVGTLHSDRYRVLRRLLHSGVAARTFAFVFIPGRLAWFLRHAIDWTLWLPGTIRLSLTPLPASETDCVIAAARAVVDVEHPKQRGLTMRTIETLLAGRKLVTTNNQIRESDLFDPSRVCVIDRRRPAIPPHFLASAFAPLSPQLRYRYSLAGWVDDLLPDTLSQAERPHSGAKPTAA